MTTNNLLYDKKIGLFLGDSILRHFLDVNVHLHQKLKEKFDLDIIETFYKGGAKLNYLANEVFPRQIAHIVNSNDNNMVMEALSCYIPTIWHSWLWFPDQIRCVLGDQS